MLAGRAPILACHRSLLAKRRTGGHTNAEAAGWMPNCHESPLKRAEEQGGETFVNRPYKGRPSRTKPRESGFGSGSHGSKQRTVLL